MTVWLRYIQCTLIMEVSFQQKLCKRADFSLRISENITSIDKDLATIRELKKLSAGSCFDTSLFANMEFDDLAALTVKLATRLIDVKCVLKDSRTILEDVDELVPVQSDHSPQLISEISELKSQLNELVLSKPEPLDYTKIASEITKPVQDAFKNIPNQTKPVINQKQAREVADIQARSCNLMIYNCPLVVLSVEPKEAAEYYLGSCGVPSIHQYYERVVEAHFVKTEGHFCTLRVVMDSQWIVNAILKDAKLLKESTDVIELGRENIEYWFKNSFITKDRTPAERDERRKLVKEQKVRIAAEPKKRWVIRNEGVFAEGVFPAT